MNLLGKWVGRPEEDCVSAAPAGEIGQEGEEEGD